MKMLTRFAFLALLFACVVTWCEASFASKWKDTETEAAEFVNAVEEKLEKGWENIKNNSVTFFSKFFYHADTKNKKPILPKETNDEWTNVEIKKYHVRKVAMLDACQCVQYNCGCCQHLEEPSIHLNSTICMNITYLSEDYGISMTVTVNNYTLFNQTVSARNPPPFCLGVPYVKQWAEACVRLYNIDAKQSSLHACIKAEARMRHVLIAEYDFGCFDIGPYTRKHKYSNERTEPFVVLL